MKHVFLFAAATALLISCNNSETKTADAKKGDSTMVAGTTDAPMDYAYTIKNPDNWLPGSRENTKSALASLKAWENRDYKTCVSYFADSVRFEADYMSQKVSRDTLEKMIAMDKSPVKIEMEDFESVKSKDGKEEWVSMWYKQKMQNSKGQWDSVEMMDDLKFMNGKIVLLSEKMRHYPKN